MPIKHFGKSPIERINEIKKGLSNLPTQIGNTALNHFKNNFKTESWEGRKWKARNGWAERNEGRALLMDNGFLQRDLVKHVSGRSIRVFVKAPSDKYADIHNTGGTITIPPSSKMIKFCWAKYYAAGSGVEKTRWKAMALHLQAGRSFQSKIPQRKFIGESQQLNDKIQKKVEAILSKF
jgi:phage gpG-like protein